MSSYYKASKPLKTVLSKVLALHVEQNRWEAASVSTPFPIYTITVSPWSSPFLTFCFLIQIATRFSLAQVNTSFVYNLYQSGPYRRSNPFCQSMKQAHTSSSVPTIRCDITISFLFLFYIKTHFLLAYPQFPFLPLSKYPPYYRWSTYHETECALHFVTFVFFYKAITITLANCPFP